jgi:uncharacterized membrane protein
MNQQMTQLPPPRKSKYKPILLTLLFSFLLAGGSCFGFLSSFNLNSNSLAGSIFAVGFLISVLVFLGSIVWLVIKAVRDRIKGGGGVQ